MYIYWHRDILLNWTYIWIYFVYEANGLFNFTAEYKFANLHPLIHELLIEVYFQVPVRWIIQVDVCFLYEFFGSLFVAFHNKEIQNDPIHESLRDLYLV